MAFQMLAYLAVGSFIGNYIDKKIGTDRPYFTILLIITFTGAYFFRLIRDLEKDRK